MPCPSSPDIIGSTQKNPFRSDALRPSRLQQQEALDFDRFYVMLDPN